VRRVLAVVVLAAALLLPAAPASAAECGPAGGAGAQPAVAPPGDFRITGGGWGHGAGMSQYGAQGAGLLGCDAATILGTYYPGTALESVPSPGGIRVSLDTDATATTVTGVAGSVPWELCAIDRTGCADIAPNLEPGRTWTVALTASAGYVIRDGATEVWRGGDHFTLLRAKLSASDADNRIVRVGNRYRWGQLEFDSVLQATPTMYVTLDIAPFDRYLYGLAEVPSSWPEETLKAQVIAARSYAALRVERNGGNRDGCRCDVYATVADQAYTGYEKESEGPDGSFGARWRAAVDATRASDFSTTQVLRYGGRIADAFYSSSHGGYSESSRFVFGGELPYIQPVDDSRWDAASANPYRSWAVTFSADDLGRRLGVGVAQELTVLDPKGNACRVGEPSRGFGGVRVRGASGERVAGGNEVRRALGLRSTLFAVNADGAGACPVSGPTMTPPPTGPPEPPPPPPPVDPPGTPVPGGSGVTMDPIVRVAGPERVATAVEVSRAHWDSASEVVIATAFDYPDALAGGALAGRLGAPLLLTESRELSPLVLAEVVRLQANRVTLLGGSTAIAQPVEDALRGAGVEVRRLGGEDRYATAAAVAGEATAPDGEVAVALGSDFADAVSAGALAATPGHVPTLLATRDGVPPATAAALRRMGARTVLLVGGHDALPATVAEQLSGLGYTVERLAGENRFATSAAVARFAMGRFDAGPRPVVMAPGSGYPDALTAGTLAARLSASVLLVPGADLNSEPLSAAWLRGYAAALDRAVLVGGLGVVSDLVRDQAARAITASPDPGA